MKQEDPEQKEKQPQAKECWWRRWKFRFDKEQMLIGLLTGILLIVIVWPMDKEKKTDKGGANVSSESSGEWEDDFDVGGATDQRSGNGAQTGGLASDAYTREMESRLAYALSKVEGVGRVQVLITWKSSSEKVVEKDVPGSSQSVDETDTNGGTRVTTEETRQEETVYQESGDGSRTPYIIKEIRPQPEGVLVVAQGGGNSVIVRQILEAVQALFPLDTHKIKIMKMEGSK